MRVLLIFICIFIFYNCVDESLIEKKELDYLPNNAALVVRSSSFDYFKELENQNELSSELIKIFPKFFGLIKKIPEKTKGQLSFHFEGKNDLPYLFITEKNILETDSANIDTLFYEKVPYYFNNSDDKIYFTTWDNLYFTTSSKLLLENCIRLKKISNNVSDDLKNLHEKTSSPQSIFLNKKIAKFINKITSETIKFKFEEWSSWTSLSFKINENEVNLKFSGFLDSNGSTSLIKHQNQLANIHDVSNLIPVSSKWLETFAFDYDNYSNGLKKFDLFYNKPETSIDSVYNLVNQVGRFSISSDTVYFLKKNSKSIDFNSFLKKYSKNQLSRNNLILYELSSEKKSLFNHISGKFEPKFAFEFDDMLFLSKSISILESLLFSIKNGEVLSNDKIFIEKKKKFARKNTFWIWASNPYFTNKFSSFFPNTNKNKIEKFKSINTNGSVDSGVYYISHEIERPILKTDNKKNVDFVGSNILNDYIEWGPYPLINHKTNEIEWIAQDEELNLYLLNLNGEIIWKQKLDGLIQGSIFQVDLFKNKKLQLAFSTSKSFQVLDRNGKLVSGYSIKSNGNNKLSIFDYDNQRNYRIFLSNGNKIDVYDRNMRKVKGWKKTKLSSSLKYPVKHIRIGNRDYISLVYKSGKAELLHRTGNIRIKIPNDIYFTEEIYAYENGFISIDNKNRLIRINSQGKISKEVLPFESKYFLTASNNTLVTLTENKLTINNQLIELDFGAYSKPIIKIFNNKTYIILNDNQSEKTYIFDVNGTLLENFPIKGGISSYLGQSNPDSPIYLGLKNKLNQLRFYRVPK